MAPRKIDSFGPDQLPVNLIAVAFGGIAIGGSVKLRLPPAIKILEALSAIGDGRVVVLDDKRAKVYSSDGSRVYRVYVDTQQGIAYSDDNGTKYRRYIGYPIIAFLMIRGVLPFDEKLANVLKGIPWRKLNETLRSYAAVERIVKEIVKSRGVEPEVLDSFVSKVMNSLRSLELYLKDMGTAWS